MRKNTNEIDIINSLITKHIENLKRGDILKQDKEIDYILIEEAIEALVREYKLSDDSRQSKYIKERIIEVYEKLYTYLININKYDHRILEIYSLLDKLINN